MSTASLIPEAPVETDAVDTFAGEVDARESTDAGRRTFDNLLANNPDFIFIIYEGNEKEAASRCNELVKSCDSWKDVFAVKSGRSSRDGCENNLSSANSGRLTEQ